LFDDEEFLHATADRAQWIDARDGPVDWRARDGPFTPPDSDSDWWAAPAASSFFFF
jgi:hypothetical protein